MSSAEFDQKQLADEMLEFVRQAPISADLEWAKDWKYLYYFEAERLLVMRKALLAANFKPDSSFSVLDFGYLHGLVPEFLHRFFPNAHFVVFDHPQSPNFRNEEYLDLIKARSYLKLEPCDISRVGERQETFDLVVLGEIIEHLDPTLTAKSISILRDKVNGRGRLVITTPNAAGIRNVVLTLMGRDPQHPVIPDPTMDYGHIHLWTPTLLEKTMRYHGWEPDKVYFTHGFDRWDLYKSNRHWGSLAHQMMIKSLYVAAELRPKWRGFMVSTWMKCRVVDDL